MASQTQRIAWKIAGISMAVALVFLVVREGPSSVERASTKRIALDERDTLVQLMLSLLERDPRVRRNATQQVVTVVAGFQDNPDLLNAEVHFANGLWAYYGRKQFEAAETSFRAACDLRPEWAWPHNNLAIVLFTQGKKDEALEAFRKAMELDPGWSRPHSDLAILYRLEGKLDRALEEVNKALELDPDGAVTHYNYAVILDVLDRREEAREQYEYVIEVDPSLPAPYYNLACHYARKGDVNAAIPFLEKAITLDSAFVAEARRDPDFDPIRTAPELAATLNGQFER